MRGILTRSNTRQRGCSLPSSNLFSFSRAKTKSPDKVYRRDCLAKRNFIVFLAEPFLLPASLCRTSNSIKIQTTTKAIIKCQFASKPFQVVFRLRKVMHITLAGFALPDNPAVAVKCALNGRWGVPVLICVVII